VSALGDGAAEVDGSESGEDECLKGRDQHDLEDEEDDGDRDRHDAERREADQRHHAAAHEQDQQVACEQVREEPDRQRDDPYEVRDHLDAEQQRLERLGRAGRDEGGEVAAHPVRTDALDVVAEPHDQGEDQRHRDVRRRGVQRERRDLEPEEHEALLAVGRQRYVADQVREPDEEEERADEREPLGREARRQVPARDVVVREVVQRLGGRLDVVRPLRHLARDVDHRSARRRRGQEQVEHRLVDAQVELADLDLDPWVELELVLRLVFGVAAGRAEDQVEDDDDPDPGREAEHDLLPGLEVLQPLGHRGAPGLPPRLPGVTFVAGCAGAISNGRMAIVIVNWSVKTAMKRTAAARPASWSPMPTATMIPATIQPRRIMLPARSPTRVRTSSAFLARRTASSLRPRWIAHAPAPAIQPPIGRPATRKMTSATRSTGTSRLRRSLTDVGVGSCVDVGSGAGDSAVVPRACADKLLTPPPEADAYPRVGGGELPMWGCESGRVESFGGFCSWRMRPTVGRNPLVPAATRPAGARNYRGLRTL